MSETRSAQRAGTAGGADQRAGPAEAAAARTVTWGELMADAEAQLGNGGVDSPEVSARRIVEEVSGASGADLHALLRTPAGRRGVARLDALLARRLAGEPLQYVLGSWGFRTLDLMVDRRVLIPRPETETVAGLAIAEVNARAAAGTGSLTAADLGTGSGAIALSIAVECPRCRVLAADCSAAALEVARANLSGLGRAATRVSLHHGDWFDALPAEARGRIDVAVANPPYVADHEALPEVIDAWEPRPALRAGPRGDEALCRIVDDAVGWLAPAGVLVLEMAPDQTEPIAALTRSAGYEPTIHDDLTGRPRAVVAQRTQRTPDMGGTAMTHSKPPAAPP